MLWAAALTPVIDLAEIMALFKFVCVNYFLWSWFFFVAGDLMHFFFIFTCIFSLWFGSGVLFFFYYTFSFLFVLRTYYGFSHLWLSQINRWLIVITIDIKQNFIFSFFGCSNHTFPNFIFFWDFSIADVASAASFFGLGVFAYCLESADWFYMNAWCSALISSEVS